MSSWRILLFSKTILIPTISSRVSSETVGSCLPLPHLLKDQAWSEDFLSLTNITRREFTRLGYAKTENGSLLLLTTTFLVGTTEAHFSVVDPAMNSGSF